MRVGESKREPRVKQITNTAAKNELVSLFKLLALEEDVEIQAGLVNFVGPNSGKTLTPTDQTQIPIETLILNVLQSRLRILSPEAGDAQKVKNAKVIADAAAALKEILEFPEWNENFSTALASFIFNIDASRAQHIFSEASIKQFVDHLLKHCKSTELLANVGHQLYVNVTKHYTHPADSKGESAKKKKTPEAVENFNKLLRNEVSNWEEVAATFIPIFLVDLKRSPLEQLFSTQNLDEFTRQVKAKGGHALKAKLASFEKERAKITAQQKAAIAAAKANLAKVPKVSLHPQSTKPKIKADTIVVTQLLKDPKEAAAYALACFVVSGAAEPRLIVSCYQIILGNVSSQSITSLAGLSVTREQFSALDRLIFLLKEHAAMNKNAAVELAEIYYKKSIVSQNADDLSEAISYYLKATNGENPHPQAIAQLLLIAQIQQEKSLDQELPIAKQDDLNLLQRVMPVIKAKQVYYFGMVTAEEEERYLAAKKWREKAQKSKKQDDKDEKEHNETKALVGAAITAAEEHEQARRELKAQRAVQILAAAISDSKASENTKKEGAETKRDRAETKKEEPDSKKDEETTLDFLYTLRETSAGIAQMVALLKTKFNVYDLVSLNAVPIPAVGQLCIKANENGSLSYRLFGAEGTINKEFLTAQFGKYYEEFAKLLKAGDMAGLQKYKDDILILLLRIKQIPLATEASVLNTFSAITPEWIVKFLRVSQVTRDFNPLALYPETQIVLVNCSLDYFIATHQQLTKDDSWLLLFISDQLISGLSPAKQQLILQFYVDVYVETPDQSERSELSRYHFHHTENRRPEATGRFSRRQIFAILRGMPPKLADEILLTCLAKKVDGITLDHILVDAQLCSLLDPKQVVKLPIKRILESIVPYCKKCLDNNTLSVDDLVDIIIAEDSFCQSFNFTMQKKIEIVLFFLDHYTKMSPTTYKKFNDWLSTEYWMRADFHGSENVCFRYLVIRLLNNESVVADRVDQLRMILYGTGDRSFAAPEKLKEQGYSEVNIKAIQALLHLVKKQSDVSQGQYLQDFLPIRHLFPPQIAVMLIANVAQACTGPYLEQFAARTSSITDRDSKEEINREIAAEILQFPKLVHHLTPEALQRFGKLPGKTSIDNILFLVEADNPIHDPLKENYYQQLIAESKEEGPAIDKIFNSSLIDQLIANVHPYQIGEAAIMEIGRLHWLRWQVHHLAEDLAAATAYLLDSLYKEKFTIKELVEKIHDSSQVLELILNVFANYQILPSGSDKEKHYKYYCFLVLTESMRQEKLGVDFIVQVLTNKVSEKPLPETFTEPQQQTIFRYCVERYSTLCENSKRLLHGWLLKGYSPEAPYFSYRALENIISYLVIRASHVGAQDNIEKLVIEFLTAMKKTTGGTDDFTPGAAEGILQRYERDNPNCNKDALARVRQGFKLYEAAQLLDALPGSTADGHLTTFMTVGRMLQATPQSTSQETKSTEPVLTAGPRGQAQALPEMKRALLSSVAPKAKQPSIASQVLQRTETLSTQLKGVISAKAEGFITPIALDAYKAQLLNLKIEDALNELAATSADPELMAISYISSHMHSHYQTLRMRIAQQYTASFNALNSASSVTDLTQIVVLERQRLAAESGEVSFGTESGIKKWWVKKQNAAKIAVLAGLEETLKGKPGAEKLSMTQALSLLASAIDQIKSTGLPLTEKQTASNLEACVRQISTPAPTPTP